MDLLTLNQRVAWQTRSQAENAVARYIDGFYNPIRPDRRSEPQIPIYEIMRDKPIDKTARQSLINHPNPQHAAQIKAASVFARLDPPRTSDLSHLDSREQV